jgi:hypothetical protein
MHEYLQVLKDFGPIVGVILFFIWRDWKREDRLASRITELEKFQQKELSDLVRDTNTAVTQSTEQLKWLISLVRGCHNREQND